MLWLGGDTTCVWNERGVEAQFQSWDWEGGWGSGEPTGGRGGLVGNLGRSLALLFRHTGLETRSGRAPHLPSPQQEPRVFEKAHSLSLPVVSLRCVEFETEVNSSEWSRFGAYPS